MRQCCSQVSLRVAEQAEKYEKTVLTVEAPILEGVSRTRAKCRCAPGAGSASDHDAGEVVGLVQTHFKRADKG